MIIEYNCDKIVILEHEEIPFLVFVRGCYLLLGESSRVLTSLLQTYMTDLGYFRPFSRDEKNQTAIQLMFMRRYIRSSQMYSRAVSILRHLGITEYEHPICYLPPIQRRHVMLANLLFRSYQYMYLDDPTKGLDSHMIEWLIEYLSSQSCILFIHSNHAEFIMRLKSQVVVIDSMYIQCYEHYEEMKACQIDAHFRNQWRIKSMNEMGRYEKTLVDRVFICLHNVETLTGDLVSDGETFHLQMGEKYMCTGSFRSGKSHWLSSLQVVHPLCRVFSFSMNELQQMRSYAYSITEYLQERSAASIEHMNNMLSKWHLLKSLSLKDLTNEQEWYLICCMISLERPHVLLIDEVVDSWSLSVKEIVFDTLSLFKGSVIIVSHDLYWSRKHKMTLIHIENKRIVNAGISFRD